MSLSHEVTVWCDGEGCAPRWEQGASTTAADLRLTLKRRGWTQEGKLDYCPACSELRVRGPKDPKVRAAYRRGRRAGAGLMSELESALRVPVRGSR